MIKNTMLAINFEYTLLEFYKRMNLSESDVMVIFMIKHLLEQKNALITAELLAIKMSLSVEIIDNILVTLLRKKYIAYVESDKGLTASLEPLEAKLSELYQEDIKKDQMNKFNEEASRALKNIYEVFEKELGRTLSPVELSLIDEWVNNGISEQACIEALYEALSKRKTSLKAVDRILLKWQARDDIEKEGHTAINDNWKTDIEKTVNIAKKKLDNTNGNK